MPDSPSFSLGKLLKRILPESLVARLQAFDHWMNGEPELRLVHKLCDRSKLSIDIGANIGTYTYFMRKHSRSVVAYEPNPHLSKRLQALFPDVKVRAAAVSDHAARVVLRMPVTGDNPDHELASIAQTFDSNDNVATFEVDAVRLDDEKLADVGFLKIDAEQHEKEVLMGALETIKRWQPVIMTESTPLLYPEGLLERFRFLAEMGYTGWFTFESRAHPFSAFDAVVHANASKFGTAAFMNPNILFFPAGREGGAVLNG
jgi:FkbM family methyltransferase